MKTLRKTDFRETERQIRAADDGDMWRGHIRSAIARGLPEFQPALFPHDGHMVLVASGPSLPRFVEDIRKERAQGRPICAVKGAHDFLCEQGIEPDMWVSVEPKARLENVQRKNDRTVYFLASRCNPHLFDWLDDRKVMLFHTYSDRESHIDELKGRQVIGGGTTSGLRACTLAYLMGFKKQILYGFDSCLADDGKTKRFTGEMAGHTVDRIVGGKRFLCNGALAMQADECQMYFQVLPGLEWDVKGDGLIAAIMEERRKRGLQ